MKRKISDNHIWKPPRYSTCSVKRRKTRSSNTDAPPASSPPLSHSSPQPLSLTERALYTTQQPTRAKTEAAIQHWVEGCAAVCDLEMTAAPPTPRSASSNDRGRRAAKHHARSRGSRTPSPSKRPSPQTYRTRNMYHAGVFVDKLDDLPPAVDGEVRRILGIVTWNDPIPAAVDETQGATHLAGLVSTFWAESRRNARECSLEGDWKASLNGVIRNLADIWPGALKTHMSEKGKVSSSPRESCRQQAKLRCQSGILISSQQACPLTNRTMKSIAERALLDLHQQKSPSLISTQTTQQRRRRSSLDLYHLYRHTHNQLPRPQAPKL